MNKNFLRMFVYSMIIAALCMAARGFAIYFNSFGLGTGAGLILLSLFFIDYTNAGKELKFGLELVWANIILVACNVLNFVFFDLIRIDNIDFADIWLGILAGVSLLVLLWIAFRMWYEGTNKNYKWVEFMKGNHQKQPKAAKVAKESKAEKELKKGTLGPKPTHRDEHDEIEIEADSTTDTTKNQ